MSAVMTISASAKTPAELQLLDRAASTLPDGELRRALIAFTASLRDGRDLFIGQADDSVTPSQAARMLGVSRAHLYKVLDGGAIPFHIVGVKDRRIRMADLRAYMRRVHGLRGDASLSATRQDEAQAAITGEV